MAQENNYADIMRLQDYNSFSDMFSTVRNMAAQAQYRGMPVDKIATAFGRAWGFNPYVQNARIKGLRSQPMQFDRKAIEDMLKNAQNNEQALRQVSAGLNFSSYPFYKLKTTIASIPTYRWYYIPQYIDRADARSDPYKRERRFIDKFCKRLDPTKHGRIITQQSLDEGKVFRYMRFDYDKSSNNVYGVDLQELPSDFCKIVGRNSDSYYSVAFNFVYFWQPGTSVDQFDPIFKDYFNMLMDSTETIPYTRKNGGRVINMAKAAKAIGNNPNVSIEKIAGDYYFWVTLPTDACFTFGIDFSNALQASMLMGLFLTGADLSQYEYLQKQLLQIPLYSILTGEIPYHDEKQSKAEDDYRLSPTGLAYYQSLFYKMMDANDTSGVDFFAAPLKNMQLQTLDSTPNATDIVTKSYQDFLTKSGINGIIATTDKPMAALVASTQKIEAQYSVLIYSQFMNMMNRTFERMNLNFKWRFVMFGDVFGDSERLKAAKEGMTLGIMADAYIYNALLGRTIEDDLATGMEMLESGIMELRVPLKTSYTASGKDGGDVINVGGRPSATIDEVKSEKTEESIDEGDGENIE